ncbi:MAG: GGDEF domain-containing protein [Sulfuriferula sp.]|nr:GGDEF domain-containing protein [Sulfuriferula sp.]
MTLLASPVLHGAQLVQQVFAGLLQSSEAVCLACYAVVDGEQGVLLPECVTGMAVNNLQLRLRETDLAQLLVKSGESYIVDVNATNAPHWVGVFQGLLSELLITPFMMAGVRAICITGATQQGFFNRIGMPQFVAFTNLVALSLGLRAEASHDPLTKLPNRTVFFESLERACVYAKRSGDLVGCGVLDLDGFKQINDSYGHDAGDRLLQYVSARIRKSLRASCVVARLGGDEFAILFVGCVQADVERMCVRVLDSVSTPMDLGCYGEVKVTASLGVTLFPLDDGDGAELMRHADMAMYAAKAAGRNQYRLHSVDYKEYVGTISERKKPSAPSLRLVASI